jgi:FHS family L-fucose permease-like MFS transporter
MYLDPLLDHHCTHTCQCTGEFNDWSLGWLHYRFNPSNQLKKILLIVVPYIAFGVVAANAISGQDVTPLYAYAFVILFVAVSFRKRSTIKNLNDIWFNGNDSHAYWFIHYWNNSYFFAFMSGGLFLSIMWPSIFSLAIAGLGNTLLQVLPSWL